VFEEKKTFKKQTNKQNKTKTINVLHGLLQWERALRVECSVAIKVQFG